jgi:hypothetical protein
VLAHGSSVTAGSDMHQYLLEDCPITTDTELAGRIEFEARRLRYQ